MMRDEDILTFDKHCATRIKARVDIIQSAAAYIDASDPTHAQYHPRQKTP